MDPTGLRWRLMRAARYRPWALLLFTSLCLATYGVLYSYPDLHLFSAASVADGFPVVPLGIAAGAVLGALILTRHPRHRIGWLLSLGSVGGGINLATGAYAYRFDGTAEPGQAAVHWAAWLGQFFGAAYALAFTCALFLLVPDGRLLSRRWWPVMGLVIASYALWAGVLLFGVPPRQVGPEGIDAGPAVDGLFELSSLMLIVAIMAAAVSLVLRLHRSTGVRRQQVRWMVASGALLAFGLLVLLGYQLAGGAGEPWYVILPLFLGYTSLPVFAGIAVLRYRLYDIDVIINRAVVLAVLVTFVTVGYVAVVVVLGATLGSSVNREFWPSLVALVLVAVAFQPLRQHVLRLANRLVYGQLAAPYEALADFSRRLGLAPASTEFLPALAEAVGRSVGASHARVSLSVPGTPGLSAAWPDGADGTSDLELEVRDSGRTLGRVAVGMPPGRGLRPAERRLLDDFTAQAGLAFRNLRLDAELRARVDQLTRQTAQLAASRRRLLVARDHERERIADVIEREALAHLRPVPAALAALDLADPTAADRSLQRLEEATGAALDAVREVTRGLFPVALTRQGLAQALRAHAGRSGRTGVLTIAPAVDGRRFEPGTEAAAYFCGVALLARFDGTDAGLDLSLREGRLVLELSGTSRDGADADEPAIVDRVEAAGGRLTGGPDSEGRSIVRVEFPVPQTQDLAADAQTAASRSVPNDDLVT